MRRTKEKLIQRFIREETPTAKELTLFCDRCSDNMEDYEIIKSRVKLTCANKENTYDALGIRGYYGTNITGWRQSGNIETIKGRVHLTPAFKKDGKSLYIQGLSAKCGALEKRNQMLRERVRPLVNKNNQLTRKLYEQQWMLERLKTDFVQRIDDHILVTKEIINENFR